MVIKISKTATTTTTRSSPTTTTTTSTTTTTTTTARSTTIHLPTSISRLESMNKKVKYLKYFILTEPVFFIYIDY